MGMSIGRLLGQVLGSVKAVFGSNEKAEFLSEDDRHFIQGIMQDGRKFELLEKYMLACELAGWRLLLFAMKNAKRLCGDHGHVSAAFKLGSRDKFVATIKVESGNCHLVHNTSLGLVQTISGCCFDYGYFGVYAFSSESRPGCSKDSCFVQVTGIAKDMTLNQIEKEILLLKSGVFKAMGRLDQLMQG